MALIGLFFCQNSIKWDPCVHLDALIEIVNTFVIIHFQVALVIVTETKLVSSDLSYVGLGHLSLIENCCLVRS